MIEIITSQIFIIGFTAGAFSLYLLQRLSLYIGIIRLRRKLLKCTSY